MYCQDQDETMPNTDSVWSDIKTDPGVLVCPTKGKSTPNGYGYNTGLAGVGIGTFTSPDSIFVTAESNDSAKTLLKFGDDVDMRHSGKAVASYLDGHVNAVATTPWVFFTPQNDLLDGLSKGIAIPAQGHCNQKDGTAPERAPGIGYASVLSGANGWARTATTRVTEYSGSMSVDIMGNIGSDWWGLNRWYTQCYYNTKGGVNGSSPCVYSYLSCFATSTVDRDISTMGTAGSYWVLNGDVRMKNMYMTGTTHTGLMYMAVFSGATEILRMTLNDTSWWGSAAETPPYKTSAYLQLGATKVVEGRTDTNNLGQTFQPFMLKVVNGTATLKYGSYTSTTAVSNWTTPTKIRLFVQDNDSPGMEIGFANMRYEAR
jgi:prepilin-type processing-associated H-X9-DG protein